MFKVLKLKQASCLGFKMPQENSALVEKSDGGLVEAVDAFVLARGPDN